MGEPDKNSVGSIGDSSNGMVFLRLASLTTGGMGVTLSLSHDGWNGRAQLDGYSLARLERLCGMALEALADRGYDVDTLRERTREYVTDEFVRARLAVDRPVSAGDEGGTGR